MKKYLITTIIYLITGCIQFSYAQDSVIISSADSDEIKKRIEETPQETIETTDKEVSQINSITDNLEKIKSWESKFSNKNYLVINKKECMATIFSFQGTALASFEVIIGKEIGDCPNDTLGISGKPKNTTPAGEFTLNTNIYNKSAYGDFTLSLGEKANKIKTSKKMVALHKVPTFRQKDRLSKFYDGNLKNNRMSHGCINFTEDDFNTLTKHIKSGYKVYILPEESGNELKLTKKINGKYEFIQTKY